MYNDYVIKDGDTLEFIAEDKKIPVYQLLEMNQLYDMIRLTPGDTIKVPNNNEEWFIKYKIQKGDTVSQLAKEYGTSVSILSQINGLENADFLYEGEELYIPKENIDVYFTLENDTVNDVLNKANITLEELLSKNQHLYLLPSQAIVYSKK